MFAQILPGAIFDDNEDEDNLYSIGVSVYEANNVSWYNLQTRVCVQLGKTVKYSKVKESSEKPFYNADFTFHYVGKLEKMMDMILTITVQEFRSGLHRHRTLGSARLDLGAIWSQPGHEISDRWILLTHPSDPTGNIRGYINCEISIIIAGEKQRLRRFHEPSGYFIPDKQGGGKLKARYIFRVHRGMNMYNPDLKNFAVFVRVFFAGLSGESTKRKKTQFPYWAEEIVFTELFPPMYNRFRIDVQFGKKEVCTKYLNLSSISDPAVKGFLPTYGPSFLHLYNPPYRFLGSLLVSLETKTVHAFSESEKLLGVKRQKTPDLIEKMFWEYEDFAIFGIIYEISMLRKDISENDLHVCLGFSTSEERPLSEENWFMSWKSRTVPMDGSYFCCPKSRTKQTVFTVEKLPDNRHRLFLGNRLLHIALKLGEDLEKIGFELDHYPETAKTKLLTLLHRIVQDCKQFKSSAVAGPTSLEKERLKTLVAKVNKLIKEMDNIKPIMKVEEIFEKSLQICKDILHLVKDPQESFPQIILTLKTIDKVLAYAQVHPSNVLYSAKENEKGLFCGIIQSLFLKGVSRRSEEVFAGKMDVLLWLGPLKSVGLGLESIPSGFQDISGEYTFPPSLKYDEVHDFICRVHLYQGHFLPCDELTGTCSIFMTVYFDCKTATSTVKELLSPVWMETLVINNAKIYGNVEDVLKNPPKIVIEVWNKGGSETVMFGRHLVKPHVFLARDKLQPPTYPPKPEWLQIQAHGNVRGEILAMFEIVQDRGGLSEAGDRPEVTKIPDYIKLSTVQYKLEILFWGLRRSRSFALSDLSVPFVTVTCGQIEVKSFPLRNPLSFPNFSQPLNIFELELPEDWHYTPPVVIRLYDNRAFGTTVFVGSHIIRNINKFLIKLPSKADESRRSQKYSDDESYVFNEARFATQAKTHYFGDIGVFEPEMRKPLIEMKEDLKSKTPLMNKIKSRRSRWWSWLCWCCRKKVEDPGYISIGLVGPLNDPDIDQEFFDWWTKYYDSYDHKDKKFQTVTGSRPVSRDKHHKLDLDVTLFGKKTEGLQFYSGELENQPDFSGFEDTIQTFLLTKHPSNLRSDTGKFKGCIALYKKTDNLMTLEGNPADDGVFSGVARELGAVIHLTVRVYVIKAHQLYSREKLGKVNPFIEVAIPSSSQVVSDSKNFLRQENNPIFGKCYQLDVTLPFDSTLVVRVMDRRQLKDKELIGETSIDLENRYYSRHRGTCGLQRVYASEGYNAWRDLHKPSEILTWLCLSYNLPLPEYSSGIVDQVIVGGQKFTSVRRNDGNGKESLALNVLLNWQRVPNVGCKLLEEHVETRSLFLPHQQGLEMGKLEMWVDIFPGMVELPPPVNVKPRTPQKYELRAVVWSTRNVKMLDDGALVGKKNTDIFVKGWLKGKEDVQKTDTHYASLTGEGFFNWRFVYNFSYDRHEQMVVLDDFSNQIPPILYLQVWDQERIGSNEYIGSLSLDLRDLPPPCKRLPMTKVYMPIKKWKRNLFGDRYARGWWPFIGQDRGRLRTVGMVDLELFLLTDLEAERSPAGRGRNEPNALPEPLRPFVKYTVWIVPFRAIKNYLWRYHKGAVFKVLFGSIMCIFIMVLIYSIPNYSVKKAMRA